MKRIIAAVILGLVFFALFASVRSAALEAPVSVDTYQVAASSLSETILASGNLTFSREIELRPEVAGKVSVIHVSPGEMVEQGQLLLTLDPVDHQAEVDQVAASLAIRQIEINRMEELLAESRRRIAQQEQMQARGFVDAESFRRQESENRLHQIDLEAARERLRQDQALMAQSMERLGKTRFHAPMAGMITRVDVGEGETVVPAVTNMAGSSLLTLADPSSYVARIRVDEADISSVLVGQDVHVFAAATPTRAAVGAVTSVGLAANRDAQGRGLHYEVEVSLGELTRLFPGMSCRAEIIIGQALEGTTIPVAAVNHRDGAHYVWVVQDGRARQRRVTPGLASDTHQIIEAGIDASDVVITGPARSLQQLSDGDQIRTGRS
jgi:HlyD family secretion protein